MSGSLQELSAGVSEHRGLQKESCHMEFNNIYSGLISGKEKLALVGLG